jgi:outer membrane protein assembly factor BamD (BamD/ComL family)
MTKGSVVVARNGGSWVRTDHPAFCALTPLCVNAQQSSQARTAEKFYVQGVRAMEKGDVDAAEKAFAKASKADPF